MENARYKQIMNDFGAPDSSSLLVALEQLANEAAQEQHIHVSAPFYYKADFIRAMLNGREFRDTNGNTWRWHHGAFWCGNISTSTFNAYNQVTEILPEPEQWEPQEGEEILVWDLDEEPEKPYQGTFLAKVDGEYITRFAMKLVGWKHAKPLPEENPWLELSLNTWPDCKITDEIEVKDVNNLQMKLVAGNVPWNITRWKRWRLAK